MKNSNKPKDLITGSKNIVLLHSDLSKQSNKDVHAVEIKTELKGLYAKELQFYEFYFLPLAASK